MIVTVIVRQKFSDLSKNRNKEPHTYTIPRIHIHNNIFLTYSPNTFVVQLSPRSF